jgi:hypothetical protein
MIASRTDSEPAFSLPRAADARTSVFIGFGGLLIFVAVLLIWN